MAARKKLGEEEEGGAYFSSPSPSIKFISSGCTLLDCALGGGYALGRVVNIVGNYSSGKTLLAIEAMAGFDFTYPEGNKRYNEVEAAFDKEYAAALGMPVDAIDFAEDCLTVEDFYNDFDETIKKNQKTNKPGLYVLDSLDALSDKAETERDIGEGSYGANKAKKMSEAFRRINQNAAKSQTALMIISQVRDNIGVVIGKKTTRSGGRALDFYASQVINLQQIGRITKTRKQVTRPIGINVRAKIEKNKIGLPFREVEFPIYFGYGIDDIEASLNWLLSVKRMDVVDAKNDKKDVTSIRKECNKYDDTEYFEFQENLSKQVKTIWKEIETEFLPDRKKYRR